MKHKAIASHTSYNHCHFFSHRTTIAFLCRTAIASHVVQPNPLHLTSYNHCITHVVQYNQSHCISHRTAIASLLTSYSLCISRRTTKSIASLCHTTTALHTSYSTTKATASHVVQPLPLLLTSYNHCILHRTTIALHTSYSTTKSIASHVVLPLPLLLTSYNHCILHRTAIASHVVQPNPLHLTSYNHCITHVVQYNQSHCISRPTTKSIAPHFIQPLQLTLYKAAKMQKTNLNVIVAIMMTSHWHHTHTQLSLSR